MSEAMTEQQMCGAVIGQWRHVHPGRPIYCGLDIEGYGPCAVCDHPYLDHVDTEPICVTCAAKHHYQPSLWRHVGGSGSFVDDAHHRAQPIQEGASDGVVA